MADTSTPQSTQDAEALGKAIAEGIRAGMAAIAPRRRVTAGEYDPKNALHPNKKLTPRLLRTVFQNGRHLQEHQLKDEEIRLLNQIVRPGRYIDRRVEVVIQENGNDISLDIRYNDKGISQQIENKAYWIDLTQMFSKIVSEQAEALKKEERMSRVTRKLLDQVELEETTVEAAMDAGLVPAAVAAAPVAAPARTFGRGKRTQAARAKAGK